MHPTLTRLAPRSAPVPVRSGASATIEPAFVPDEPLELPPPWRVPSRPAVPILASVVPVLAAVGLWLATGSVFALWLAALGPLIAGATMLDGARSARRDRRRTEAEAGAARARIAREVQQRHADERARRWARHPDVAAYVARDGEIWRSVPGRGDLLAVGAGTDTSAVRVIGGGDDPDSVQLRARAARLTHAPVLVPAASGIAVLGAPVLAAAVVRALVLQLCMSLPPGQLRIVGPLRGENAWAQQLPHRRAVTGSTLHLSAPGEPVPEDVGIVIVRADSVPPPGCGTVITVTAPQRCVVDTGADAREIEVEAIGEAQARGLAEDLTVRAAEVMETAGADESIALGSLPVAGSGSARGSLPAVIGVEAGDPFTLDLVSDGPHAVVAGVTGSGKSELLITWIIAMAAAHSTRQVSFLLADFKGGTAFDCLTGLAHVTGVITDLDGAGARRAIESLRAELRWRETELARAGARDILDPRVDMPRLVIVVDEFAALLGDHPELHAVFTDIAARGRALGMHLILGTQRPAGVIRESLLANCALRVSLRVTDPADSRATVGTDEAAALPGGTAGRGLALLRAAADSSPRRVRIALSAAADIEAVARRSSGPRPRRPWLPELPSRIDLEDLCRVGGHDAAQLLIGLADEPEWQRQQPMGISVLQRGLFVIGAGGSGKTTAVATIAAQAPGDVRWIGSAAEAAWDGVERLVQNPPAPGTVVIVDDLDVAVAALSPDHARELLDRLEGVARGAGAAELLVVVSAQRLTGGMARLADLLPRRLVLAATSRTEHIAAGGDPAHWCPTSPPGRGRLDGRLLQVATAVASPRRVDPEAGPWHPRGALTGAVMRRSPATRAAIEQWRRAGARVCALAEFEQEPEWGAAPVVVTADAEEWQRHWRTLTMIRSDHDLVVDASYGSELRVLTGERGIPPYCDSGRARAWLLERGGPPTRITLPVRDAPRT